MSSWHTYWVTFLIADKEMMIAWLKGTSNDGLIWLWHMLVPAERSDCFGTYWPLGDVIRPLMRWNWGWFQTNSTKLRAKHSPKEQSRHHTHVDLMPATYSTYCASFLYFDPYSIDKGTTSFRWQYFFTLPGVLMADWTILAERTIQMGSTVMLRPLHPHCQGALQED